MDLIKIYVFYNSTKNKLLKPINISSITWTKSGISGSHISTVATAALAKNSGSSLNATSRTGTDSSSWSPRNRSLEGTRTSVTQEEIQGLIEAEVVTIAEGLNGIKTKLNKFEPMWLNYETGKFFASALEVLEKTASWQDCPDREPDAEVNAKIFALFDKLWEVLIIPSLGLEDAMRTVFLLGYASLHNYPLTRLTRIVNELEKWVPKANELPSKMDPVLMMALILGQVRLRMSNPMETELVEIRRLERLFAPLKSAAVKVQSISGFF